MQNKFETHQLVMYNDSIDCFKSIALFFFFFFKKAIFQIPSCDIAPQAELIAQFLQGFEKVSILLTYRSNNLNVQDVIGLIT